MHKHGVWFNRVVHVVVCLVAVGAHATSGEDKVLLGPSATGVNLKAWTLQAPINALGPIAPNGTWAVDKQAIVATGTAAPWTIRTTGDAAWTDYRLSVRVTIRKPAPKADFPVFHAEFDRYLPREWFPPLCQHTGHYRYRYYAGEFDWGSDAAVLVRHQSREQCYRVQLSTEYQEMILWHGVGGYLQVVPCELKPGRTYHLEVLARGARLRVLLDGKQKIDYWHETLPTLAGRIGLAAYRATVAFRDVTVTALPAAPASAPPHRARFSTRRWRGLRWVFDGNEPIVLMERSRNKIDNYLSKVLFYHFVKLRPGYRPLYFCWVSILAGPHGTQLAGDENTIRTTGEGTGQLVLKFQTADPEKTLRVDHTDRLTFDQRRGTYRHDLTSELTFLAEKKRMHLEFIDPLTYNNKEPGRGVKYPWLPAGHQWGVFRAEDGSVRRHPISQSLNLSGQNNWWTSRDHSFWMLYPDRAVAPVWEQHVPGEQCFIGVCHWGYDWHQNVRWKKQRTFKPGERFTIRYALTGYPPDEAERVFLQSTLAAQNDQPEKFSRGRFFMSIPSPYAYPVCDPAGTDFTRLYNTRVPYVGWQFYGDYTVDTTVGHNDHHSLRLDGPAKATGLIYHHMFDGHAKKYLCTVWLKTRGVRGKAMVDQVRYPYKANGPCDTIKTGWTGDTDWRQVAFATAVPSITPETYDATDFTVALDGPGTVWVDDFTLRPIEAGEKVVEHRPKPGTSATGPAPSPDYLIHLRCDEGDGASLYDVSHHGNSAKLHGTTWVRTGKRAAVRFGGQACAFVPNPSRELRPTDASQYPHAGLTLDAWVRPSAGKPGGAIVSYYTSPLLYVSPAGKQGFTLNLLLTCAGKSVRTSSKPLIPPDQWTHVAATVADGMARLYVNGKPVVETKLAGKMAYRAYFQMISIGTFGQRYGYPYHGDLAGFRWWARAATAKELAAAAASRPE